MKILQVIQFFSPEHGGSSIVSYYLSKELSKRGHEVTIFTSDYKLSREWVESLHKVKVCSFKVWLSLDKFHITPSMIKNAKEKIKYFDLIHMHNYRGFQNIVVYHYAKKYNVPYVLQAHGSLPRIMPWRRLKWIYDVFFGYGLLRDASRVIALSRIEAEQYRAMGVPENKIAIIPNGIDLSEYSNLPPKGLFKNKYNIPEDKRIILYLGRIHKVKGIDLLVKAYVYLAKNLGRKDAILVIAGPDDGYLSETKAIVRSLGIDDSVIFTGPLYGKDKLEAYVDSDVYVLPSKYEIFGITVLEAYACSKPVVASAVGGLKELVVNYETGLLFKFGKRKQLAEYINFLLMNQDEANRMGLNARKFVEKNFSIEKIVDMLEEVYGK